MGIVVIELGIVTEASRFTVPHSSPKARGPITFTEFGILTEVIPQPNAA